MTKSPSDLTPLPRRRLKAFLGFWPLVLSGMVVLLAVLAFLQYRWTNEATAASEMRIGAELESFMMKWHGDLYGEFSAICTAMQVGPDSGARDTWNDYLERYVEWNNALRQLSDFFRGPLSELGMSIQAGTDRGAADRQIVKTRQSVFQAIDVALEQTRPAGHLLAHS